MMLRKLVSLSVLLLFVLHDIQMELLLFHCWHFNTNFALSAWPKILHQNGVYLTNAYPASSVKFSHGDTIVLHDKSLKLVDDLIISAWWGSTRTWSALHQCSAIFETTLPLLNLFDAHGITAKCLLNLPHSFHLGISKLLAKFDAVLLLKSLHHFVANENQMGIHYIHSLTGLPASDVLCKQEIIHIYAWRSPAPFSPKDTSRAWFVSVEKKLRLDVYLNRPRICLSSYGWEAYTRFGESIINWIYIW